MSYRTKDSNNNDDFSQPVYVQDVWMGQTAWFTTAYFVDPLVICNGGRLLQNNFAEAEKSRAWVRVRALCWHPCHHLQMKVRQNLLAFIIVGCNWNSGEKGKSIYCRSSSDFDNHGTGDRLLIQTGTTDNLVSIPLTQAEADMTSDW